MLQFHLFVFKWKDVGKKKKRMPRNSCSVSEWAVSMYICAFPACAFMHSKLTIFYLSCMLREEHQGTFLLSSLLSSFWHHSGCWSKKERHTPCHIYSEFLEKKQQLVSLRPTCLKAMVGCRNIHTKTYLKEDDFSQCQEVQHEEQKKAEWFHVWKWLSFLWLV